MPTKCRRTPTSGQRRLASWDTENIFRNIRDCSGVNIGGTCINNLRYADDTVLLAESEGDLQAIVNKVNKAGKAYNMKVNINKKNHGNQ